MIIQYYQMAQQVAAATSNPGLSDHARMETPLHPAFAFYRIFRRVQSVTTEHSDCGKPENGACGKEMQELSSVANPVKPVAKVFSDSVDVPFKRAL